MSLMKYRLRDVATDFGVAPKEIAEIISKYFEKPKSNTQVLTEEELNVIFDHMTLHNQITSLEQIFAVVTKPAPKAEPKPEVKAEAPKAEAKPEKKPEQKPQQAQKPQQPQQPQARPAQQQPRPVQQQPAQAVHMLRYPWYKSMRTSLFSKTLS